jgi:hypothetical protein
MQQEQSNIEVGNLVLVYPGLYATERKPGRETPLTVRVKGQQVGLVVENLSSTKKLVFVMGDYLNFIFVGNHSLQKIGEVND